MPATGRADAATLAALAEAAPGDTVVSYQVTAEDVAGPFTEHIPDDMMERAALPALELPLGARGAERAISRQPRAARARSIRARQFNAAGETLQVPNVRALPEPPAKGAKPASVTVTVSK